MQRCLIPVLAGFACVATPVLAADLEGPVYSERERVVVERPAPPVVVERERIIEHHYYEPREEVYVAPRYYEPRVYAPYGYNYAYEDGYRFYGRPAYFAHRPYWWHHHHPYRF
jgi:hypothetical protein